MVRPDPAVQATLEELRDLMRREAERERTREDARARPPTCQPDDPQAPALAARCMDFALKRLSLPACAWGWYERAPGSPYSGWFVVRYNGPQILLAKDLKGESLASLVCHEVSHWYAHHRHITNGETIAEALGAALLDAWRHTHTGGT